MKSLFASFACLSLCAVLALAGDAGKAPKIDGAWTATSLSVDGKKLPDEILEKLVVVLTFKDGKYSTSVMGKEDETGAYKVDTSKKPAHIDFMIASGKDKDKTQLGVVKMDGNVITAAFAKAGSKDRPKDFEGGEGQVVVTLKKAK